MQGRVTTSGGQHGDGTYRGIPRGRREAGVLCLPATRYATLIVVVALLSAVDAQAAAIGMPERTARIGLLLGLMSPSLDPAPEGQLADDEPLQQVSLAYTDWRSRDLRYWAEAYYSKAGQRATSDRIGHNVAQVGGRLSLQKNFHAGTWRPWLGLGLDLSQVRYTSRHSVDIGGFLVRNYPDATDTQAAVLVTLVSEWHLSRRWDVAGRIEQMLPVGDGLGGFSVSIGALFTY